MWLQGLLKKKTSYETSPQTKKYLKEDEIFDEETPDGFVDVSKQTNEILKHNLKMKSSNKKSSKNWIREVRDKDNFILSIDIDQKVKNLEFVLDKKDLSRLKTINADNCDIEEISENEFPLCMALERLWLNNNRIENLDLLLETISHCCPNLLHLSLLGNPCCPINDSKLYKEYQLKIIMAFPSIQFIDADEISWDQKKIIYEDNEEAFGKIEEDTDEEDDISDVEEISEEVVEEEGEIEDNLEETEEENIQKLIELKKLEIETKKKQVENLMKYQKIRENLKDKSEEILEFFCDKNINKQIEMLLKQIEFGVQSLYLFEDFEHLEQGIDILNGLLELIKSEMEKIKEKIRLDEIKMERIRKEEEERLRLKKIRDEFMKWELIERSRIKRMQAYKKKKKKENLEEEQRKEEILDLMILDEMAILSKLKKDETEEEQPDLKSEIQKYLKPLL